MGTMKLIESADFTNNSNDNVTVKLFVDVHGVFHLITDVKRYRRTEEMRIAGSEFIGIPKRSFTAETQIMEFEPNQEKTARREFLLNRHINSEPGYLFPRYSKDCAALDGVTED